MSSPYRVGEQTEFEAVGALFTCAAKFVFARRLVGAGGEVLVAAPAATAFGDDNRLVGVGKAVDKLPGLVVIQQGANGDFEGGVFAGLTRAVGAEAVATALRLPLGIEAEVD